MEGLAPALLRAGKGRFARTEQAEFAREYFLGEIAFADEQRDDEDTRGEHPAQDLPDIGFLLPKGLPHLREEGAPPQCIRVLASRRGGIGVQSRAVTDQHQSGV